MESVYSIIQFVYRIIFLYARVQVKIYRVKRVASGEKSESVNLTEEGICHHQKATVGSNSKGLEVTNPTELI